VGEPVSPSRALRGTFDSPGADHKARVRAWLGDLARKAEADDPAELAYGLMLLIDGALCARTMQNDRQAGARARRTAQILLQEVLG